MTLKPPLGSVRCDGCAEVVCCAEVVYVLDSYQACHRRVSATYLKTHPVAVSLRLTAAVRLCGWFHLLFEINKGGTSFVELNIAYYTANIKSAV